MASLRWSGVAKRDSAVIFTSSCGTLYFVAAPSLRLLALGELAESERVFKALLAENESLFVEHKTDIAKGEGYQLAKAAASFANTLGGWILVGVKNGEPVL